MGIGLQLLWLTFDSTDNGDGTHTLEAMASVPPPRVNDVLAEVAAVLAWAHRHFPEGPRSLDEGGEWDVLLQAQVNDAAPVTLHHDTASGHFQGLPLLPLGGDRPTWVCVTLTLAATHAMAEALSLAVDQGF
jgi:hypothetical protein